jgi:hypothetical protein
VKLGHFEPWAYGKEKIRGAERNLPDFFGICPTDPENFFVQQFNFDDLPPSLRGRPIEYRPATISRKFGISGP